MEGEYKFIPTPEAEKEIMPEPEETISPEFKDKKTYEAEIFCSRCGRFIEKKPGFEKEGRISHGTCPECAKKTLEEARAAMKEYERKNSILKKE